MFSTRPGDRHALAQAENRAAEAAVVRDSLDRLHDQLRDMAQHGVSWQSQLRQQVDDVRHSTDVLRRETASLSTALRKPQVRGRWGELHLRRVVELAGMVDRCDFTEQLTTRGDEGAMLRPDLVVNLAGGKQVVVDAKVPLDAFLDACAVEPGSGSDTDAVRDAHLARHARQLRQHVDTLAAKAYWRALPATPEFVVLFVPGESFLSAALEAEPTLLEYAAAKQVVLATPTTLIALLRTVSYAWTQQTVADKAREIHELGRDLHDRLVTMSGHLDRLGRSLTGAVSAYNRAVGSLENRVLVSARRFHDLGVGGEQLESPAAGGRDGSPADRGGAAGDGRRTAARAAGARRARGGAACRSARRALTRGGGPYRAGVSTSATHHRTLWEEGRTPGRLVANAAGVLVLLVVLVDLAAFRGLTLLFDVAFVLICIAAALAVRPTDFFVIGVFPPLLMLGTVGVLALTMRGTVADPADGLLQAIVSGLAHHSGSLVVGYVLTLGLLALRQVARRNAGTIRTPR